MGAGDGRGRERGGGDGRRAGGRRVDEYESGRSTLLVSEDAAPVDDGEGVASMALSTDVRNGGGGQDAGNGRGQERGESGGGERAPG